MKTLLSLFLTAALSCQLPAVPVYPGTAPGRAAMAETASGNQTVYRVSNALLSATYVYDRQTGKLTFGGLSVQGKIVAAAENTLFIINLKDGSSLRSENMTLQSVSSGYDPGDRKAVKAADRIPSRYLEAVFAEGAVTVRWRAVLHNGSHYLRTEMKISSSEVLEANNVIAMRYRLLPNGGAVVVRGTAKSGNPVTSPDVFCGLETPTGVNFVTLPSGSSGGDWNPFSWSPTSWTDVTDSTLIPEDMKTVNGTKLNMDNLTTCEGAVSYAAAGTDTVTFRYASGTHRLNMVGVQLLNEHGSVISQDIHAGYTGGAASQNSYTLQIPAAGTYRLRYWVETQTETITSSGTIEHSLSPVLVVEEDASNDPWLVQGRWPRSAALQPDASETLRVWEVSSVIGVLAPGQERRSVLAYTERQRAVPYRFMVHYNSWYELNINRNGGTWENRMQESQCLPVVEAWKKNLFDAHQVGLDAFVWDDGWDDFDSLWNFHPGFPDGFSKLNTECLKQGAGQGAWLGPTGGYAPAQGSRLNAWKAQHPEAPAFNLSNSVYFEGFTDRCKFMVRNYDMRYFKFDGIGSDAEGIINVIRELRTEREDLYFNCTVGTWASPFWYMYADSTWRDGNDYQERGDGDNDGYGHRNKWLTYRDDQIHSTFVTKSPLCTLNSLMFHGVIHSSHGGPNAMSKDVESVKWEMRLSVVCGSSLQELYLDKDLMTAEHWAELARCIKWFRSNRDVLADVHWVGGAPWDDTQAENERGGIYGWAAWNRDKATLALRNSSKAPHTYTFTLRQALDIPPGNGEAVAFRAVYDDQPEHRELTEKPLSPDTPVTVTMQPYEAIVFDTGADTVSPRTAWDAWIAANLGGEDANNEALAAETADPDGDGIVNLMEFALGGDMLKPDRLNGREGDTALITHGMEEGHVLTMTFTPNPDAVGVVRYTAQFSNDLTTWEDVPVELPEEAAKTPTPVTVKDPNAAAAIPRRFARLKVEMMDNTAK